jgi:hypothetical protein
MPSTPVTIPAALTTVPNLAIGNDLAAIKQASTANFSQSNNGGTGLYATGQQQIWVYVNNALSGLVNGLQTAFNALTTSGSTSVNVPVENSNQEITLSTGTTNIVPASSATVGAVLFVVLTEDGTGGRQITWDSHFKGVTTDDINTNAGAINIYQFFGRADGNWWLASMNLNA